MNGEQVTVRHLVVDAGSEGQRLDNFLLRELKSVPKSAIYRIIRKGEVRVNKGRCKPEYKLQVGDQVRVPPIRTRDAGAAPVVGEQLRQVIESRILFEDDGLIVLDKPTGLAVHGGSGISHGVIETMRVLRPEARFLELVHRLDRDTSGCLMVAKKRSQLRYLHDQLKAGNIKKTYVALLWGRWKGRQHRVEAPLFKTHLASGERIVRVAADGKPSLTLFRQVALLPDATLVEASPVTGRTHQIRVHAQFSGHPIAGDPKYLGSEQNQRFVEAGLKRLFLHAARLEVPCADGGTLRFEAALPDELEQVVARLRSQPAGGRS